MESVLGQSLNLLSSILTTLHIPIVTHCCAIITVHSVVTGCYMLLLIMTLPGKMVWPGHKTTLIQEDDLRISHITSDLTVHS